MTHYFDVTKKAIYYPKSADPIETEIAKEIGVFVEISQTNHVNLKYVCGGYKTRDISDLNIWTALVESRKKIKKLEAELAVKGVGALKRERKRVADLLERASQELALHQPSLMLALEIAKNPDAEKAIFGGKRIA